MMTVEFLLLLDEPIQDLSEQGVSWLVGSLREWPGGLLVVSHDPRILCEFFNFFIFGESGCQYQKRCEELRRVTPSSKQLET